MNLNTLKPNHGSKHRRKRLGCGESSGHGKTSGRGGKGQSARSGGSIRIGFEGGQMPLIRRLPKRGFNNSRFSDRYALLNLDQFDVFADNETVDREAIIAKGLLRRSAGLIKVLGRGVISKKLHIVADAFSEAASSAIVAAGGTASISNARG